MASPNGIPKARSFGHKRLADIAHNINIIRLIAKPLGTNCIAAPKFQLYS
jgi:hypothetical protein